MLNLKKTIYIINISYTNKETLETVCMNQKLFSNRQKAEIAREKIVFELQANSDIYIHYNKCFKRIKCNCGESIDCLEFTNTCDNCEADYNMQGDLLAPRKQWGIETGEQWQDCY